MRNANIIFQDKDRVSWSCNYGLIEAFKRLGYEIREDSDLVFVVCPEQMDIEFLKRIKNKFKVGILNDSLFYTRLNKLIKERVKYFDVIFCLDEDEIPILKQYGAKKVLKYELFVDELMFRPLLIEQNIDYAFIGTLYKGRRKIVNELKGFPIRYLQSFVGKNKKEITENYVKTINNIKVNFNLFNYLKIEVGRVFETLSCGQFILQPEVKEPMFRNGEHLITYKDAKDAMDKARYYLKHEKERKEIAENGRKEILSKHTTTIKLKEMLSLI